MIINKIEIFEIYKMSMGCYEDEEKRRAIEFIDKLYIGNGNTHMTAEELWKTLDNILAYALETEEKTEDETENEAENETENETEAEEVRKLIYDFFFKW